MNDYIIFCYKILNRVNMVSSFGFLFSFVLLGGSFKFGTIMENSAFYVAFGEVHHLESSTPEVFRYRSSSNGGTIGAISIKVRV